MKIIEVRESLIKLEIKNAIALSSFILVKDTDKQYIAQVIQISPNGSGYTAYAKILYLYNNTILAYDNTLPSKDSEIEFFSWDVINKTIDMNIPVCIGNIVEEKSPINVDETAFDKKTLISIETDSIKKLFLTNVIKQLSDTSNVIILDMQGNISASKSFIAGKDFKLPLNAESLAFLYEDCLNDATFETKALVKDIFKDLLEYSKSVDFLPFETLKTIVDDMVEKSHIFKLLVLKNKLVKFSKSGYFANNKQEAENINNILNSDVVTINLSYLDSVFQNRYLKVIYDILEKMDINLKVFVNISNSVSKSNLKTMVKGKVSTTIIANSKFKYLSDLKLMYCNYIIEPTFTVNEIFNIYKTFLGAMQKGSLFIVGDYTNYIPLVAVEEALPIKTISQISESEEQITTPQQEVINKYSNDSIAKISEELKTENALDTTVIFTENNEQEIKQVEFEDEKTEILEDVNSFDKVVSDFDDVAQNYDYSEREKSEFSTVVEVTETKEEPESIENIEQEPDAEEVFPEIITENIVEDIETKEDVEDIIDISANEFTKVTENIKLPQPDNNEEIIAENSEVPEYQAVQGDEIIIDETNENLAEDVSASDIDIISQQEPEISEEETTDEVAVTPEEDIEEISILEEETPQIQNLSEITSDKTESRLLNSFDEFHTQFDSTTEISVDFDISDIEDNTDTSENGQILEELSVEENLLSEDIVNLTEEQDLSENFEQEKLLTGSGINEFSDENNILTENELLLNEEEFIEKQNSEIVEDINSEPEEIISETDDAVMPEEDNMSQNADIIDGTDSEVDEDISDNDLNAEFQEGDILVDISEPDELDKEISQDVDSIYTSIKETDISEDDLDLIDELNSENADLTDEVSSVEGSIEQLDDFEEVSEDDEQEGFLEPLEELTQENKQEDTGEVLQTKNTTTPIVPVYDAEIPDEDKVISDVFEQGDTVVHAKYGTGIVEKMIKYGAKSLYSINFDNVGRRLLDPTLTELKKV